jgi:hypothetical protein
MDRTDWRWLRVSIMDTLVRLLAVVCIAGTLMGCSTKVASEKVYGSYVASYPFGTETITLNRDGSVVQLVVINGQPPVTVHGTWEFDPEASRVNFSGLMVVADGFGHLRNDWQTVRAGTVSRDVELHWFRVVMASGATYPYVKR